MRSFSLRTSFVLGQIAVPLLLTAAFAGKAAAQIPSELVGTWRLVSFVGPDSAGNVRPVWGGRSSGLIIYTAEGYVSAQMYDSRRLAPDTAAARQMGTDAADRLITYFGTVSVDTAQRRVSHHITGASGRALIGTTVVRAYRFLGRDTIELRVVEPDANAPQRPRAVLVWERVRR